MVAAPPERVPLPTTVIAAVSDMGTPNYVHQLRTLKEGRDLLDPRSIGVQRWVD